MSGNGNDNNENGTAPIDSGTSTGPTGTAPGAAPPPPPCPVGIVPGSTILFTGSGAAWLGITSGLTRAWGVLLSKVAANAVGMCTGCPLPCVCIPVPTSFPQTFPTFPPGPFGIPTPTMNVWQTWAAFCF